jgi:mycothiol synthase
LNGYFYDFTLLLGRNIQENEGLNVYDILVWFIYFHHRYDFLMQSLIPRPYASPDDLYKILSAVGTWNTQTDFCGYLHPGHVGHFISNGLRGCNPAEHLFLVEDAQMALVAVVLIHKPRTSRFDILVHPAYRGSDLETSLVIFAEQLTWKHMQAAEIDRDWVGSDVMVCDTIRSEILRQNGYNVGEPYVFFTVRSLTDPIPESVVPEGFTIRHVEGLHEAEALGVVHGGAFGSNWQPGEYRKVMQSPGFQMERELIVVAPDGRFASFLIYWLDPISQSGSFELVGCHPEFQRKGLTRALMYEGMRRMQSAGMITAFVVHESSEENPAASALYASLGFKQKHPILESRKTMRASSPRLD